MALFKTRIHRLRSISVALLLATLGMTLYGQHQQSARAATPSPAAQTLDLSKIAAAPRVMAAARAMTEGYALNWANHKTGFQAALLGAVTMPTKVLARDLRTHTNWAKGRRILADIAQAQLTQSDRLSFDALATIHNEALGPGHQTTGAILAAEAAIFAHQEDWAAYNALVADYFDAYRQALFDEMTRRGALRLI